MGGRCRRTLFNLAPLLEMSPYNILCLCYSPCFLYPTDVKRAVLPLEAAHTAHVVTVVCELVAREAVLGRVGQRRGRIWQHMPVFAFPAVGAAAAREEEAAVLVPRCVCPREAGVAFDVAACLGLDLTVVRHIMSSQKGEKYAMERTWSSCPRDHPQPICCTRCLSADKLVRNVWD